MAQGFTDNSESISNNAVKFISYIGNFSSLRYKCYIFVQEKTPETFIGSLFFRVGKLKKLPNLSLGN